MCRAATPPLDEFAVASASSLAAGHELHAPSEADLAREGPLSREQVAEFYESGVVLVRGLLQGDLLDRVLAVRRSVGTMMPNAETYGTVKTEAWREHACFLDVALRSPLAAAAEQLTPDEVRGAGRGKPLHVLRDGFFSLSPGKRGCGWRARRPPRPAQKTLQKTLPRHVLGRFHYRHVDDFFFWPTKRDGPGPGVNVWVALDAVEAGAGGGLAYAPGSHRPDFLPQRAVIAPPGEERLAEMRRDAPRCISAQNPTCEMRARLGRERRLFTPPAAGRRLRPARCRA